MINEALKKKLILKDGLQIDDPQAMAEAFNDLLC